MTVKKTNSSNHANEILLEERCVINKVLKFIGKRWVAEILLLVEKDVNRFSQLKSNLEGISDNVLSSNLTALCKFGLLHKKIHEQVPLKVEYFLTTSGLQIMLQLHGLCTWGKRNIETPIR